MGHDVGESQRSRKPFPRRPGKGDQYWIDNYFNTPEYYCIDGKPVLMIWSPAGMDRDVIAIEKKKGNTLEKGQGVKMLLDLSQKDGKRRRIQRASISWP